jgi:hypothetical protein
MGRQVIGDRNLMRGFLAFLFLGLVALGAGAIGYNMGLSQTVTTAAANGATVVYGGGGHWGGLLLLPFAFFLVPLSFICFFGFLAFAFGPRRRFGRGPWGGHDHADGPMGFGRMSGRGWDGRGEWIAEAHRRMHEADAARSGSSSGTTSASGSSGPSNPSGGPSAG